MSTLADFVNEQRSKSSGVFAGVRQSVSVGDFGSKMTSSFSSFFSANDAADDTVLLTESSSTGQLPTSRNRKPTGTSWFSFGEEINVCGLSRFQRYVMFFLLSSMAAFCFASAMMLLPMLVVATRKFAMLNTLGSFFFLVSFVFLWGPLPYAKFLFSESRRVVAAAYVLSVLTTLYASIWLQSTIATIVCAVFQGGSLVWFVFSFVPGGERGLRFLTGLCSGLVTRQSKLVLPI